MMIQIRSAVRPALVLFLLFSLVTGVIYPLLVTGLAQTLFEHRANGSLIEWEGRIAGSELIGQAFADPEYFWGRPSATSPTPYNAAASAGSNLAPTNLALVARVQERIAALTADNEGGSVAIPVDLVTASASGLDPHISVAAAMYQVPRVAAARGLDEGVVTEIVAANTQGPTLGFLGEARVHVLRMNMALDALQLNP
jgi:K+-transporting ATPase ATPase C chain